MNLIVCMCDDVCEYLYTLYVENINWHSGEKGKSRMMIMRTIHRVRAKASLMTTSKAMGIADEKTAIFHRKFTSIDISFRVLLRKMWMNHRRRWIYVNGSRQKQSSELSINLLQIHSLHSLSSMSISNLYTYNFPTTPLLNSPKILCSYTMLCMLSRLELESAQIEMIECEISFIVSLLLLVNSFIISRYFCFEWKSRKC